MPVTSVFSGGLANGNSIALRLQLPEIELRANMIDSISVIRGGGRLLTDGDQALVGISHQTDIQTADLLDDQDDFLSEVDYDMWWVHGISETDHVQDRLDTPEQVAGPQTVIFFNGTGATAAIRVDVSHHSIRVPNITEWTLLKKRTSYEQAP